MCRVTLLTSSWVFCLDATNVVREHVTLLHQGVDHTPKSMHTRRTDQHFFIIQCIVSSNAAGAQVIGEKLAAEIQGTLSDVPRVG